MRFLLSLAVVGIAALAAAPTVFGDFKICYPSCTTYTADFSGSGAGAAIDEKTPWYGQIGLNQFNDHSGARTLTSVTLRTLLYFNSTVWMTRTGPSGNGAAKAGVMLHMDLTGPNAGKLGQYWGRFGDYVNIGGTAYPNEGYIGQDTTGITQGAGNYAALDAASPTLFVNYTYPLFDVINAPVPQIDQNTEGGPMWAYYTPSTDASTYGWPQFWYGQVGSGTYVERLGDQYQPLVDSSQSATNGVCDLNDPQQFDPDQCKGWISQYFVQQPESTLTNEDSFAFTNDPTAFPLNVEKELGFSSFNRFNRADDSVAFTKTINVTDHNGGINGDITPQQMLALFTGTGQVHFDADAIGQVATQYTGGNAVFRQQTYAKVAMRVEYTYTLCSACTDPQFGGFQGQSYQIHGFPGSYFNLFSAPSFQMNGRFTYLATGHCKYSHTPCWTHPGTYIDDITFVVDELLVRITAGPVGSGYTLLINEEPFNGGAASAGSGSNSTDFVPTKFYDRNTRLTVHLLSPLRVIVKTELVAFTIHNADHFFNLDSQLLVRPIMAAGRKPSAEFPHPQTGAPWFPEYPIHGFIGQTWANKQYPHNKLYAGEVDDYVEARPYGTDSLFSQYTNTFTDKQLSLWE